MADEKRRVAVRRFEEARKPPTGDSRASGGPRTPAATRATIGPRKPTAATRKSAVISEVAAAVSGAQVVAFETANSGAAPASAISPPITRPGPDQPRLDRGVGERERRRHSRGAPSGGQDREQGGRDSAADGRGDRQPAGADGEGLRGDAVAHEPVGELAAEDGPGPDPGRGSDQADDRRLPGDHAADLAGRPGHRSQERDLALALLDRQAHRAGHDEDRDEQRQSAERGGHGDQRGPRRPGGRDTRPCRARPR